MYSVMLKLSVAGHLSLAKDFMGHFFPSRFLMFRVSDLCFELDILIKIKILNLFIYFFLCSTFHPEYASSL